MKIGLEGESLVVFNCLGAFEIRPDERG